MEQPIIVSLNCIVAGSKYEYEVFTIEISNDKKYELLKHMVKKRLAPLFNSVLSTQIVLRPPPPNRRIFKPMTKISQDFTTSPNENGIYIYVDPPKINFLYLHYQGSGHEVPLF
ncbi:hypothetical protein F8M41_000054 [Gigaspora margarita]|uniref:Uncharacterized protein n=1 Tax=Gigaspora margarita TaxID=4874 RepID=A0A8H4B5X9_GIGMA|nr:hypothetical protein F8M41_000054 [Gigaspora margarita]